jgi:hypothetical protein
VLRAVLRMKRSVDTPASPSAVAPTKMFKAEPATCSSPGDENRDANLPTDAPAPTAKEVCRGLLLCHPSPASTVAWQSHAEREGGGGRRRRRGWRGYGWDWRRSARATRSP